jgi:hypothetical protein
MADSKYRWQFATRFRRNAFGWRSQPAIARVHEAVVEIRKVARRDPVLAAEGAVQYLQKRLIPTELARRAELNHLAALRSDRIRTAATSIHPWENMVHVQCQCGCSRGKLARRLAACRED